MPARDAGPLGEGVTGGQERESPAVQSGSSGTSWDVRRSAFGHLAAVAAGGLLVATMVATAYWAGTTAVTPPSLPVEQHPAQSYQVAAGIVEQSLSIPVTATWPVDHSLLYGGSGVVTSVDHAPGALAQAGAKIATVDLEPVILAQGDVPMFRTLREGVSGRDVIELQRMLASQGFGPLEADGTFGARTRSAVKRWQRSIGASADGVVSPGEVVFSQRLPVRLEVAPAVGAYVQPETELARLFGDHPTVVAHIAASQRPHLDAGVILTIDGPDDRPWSGELGPLEPQPDGGYVATVLGDLCADDCASVPLQGETALRGSATIVPRTEGLVVPVSALVREPSGKDAVRLPDGTHMTVSVIAAADGFAVVEGIAAGTTILLPAPP